MKARFTRLLHELRTQGQTPVQKAAGVALGFFIGATPFFGLHLLMALVLGRLLRLNIIRIYVAANISNPLVAPVLTLAEIQTGAWLRMGRVYTLDHTPSDVWAFAQDLLLGTLIIGGGLAATGFVVTWIVTSRRRSDPVIDRLFDETAERYLSSGPTAWLFAHGKLTRDPLYRALITDRQLPSHGTLADMGCGQGLALSLLATARALHREGIWPAGWPEPPLQQELWGIDRRPRVSEAARLALGSEATIVTGDLRDFDLPRCRAALVCDVLHLVGREDQDRLLTRIVAVLETDGVLVLREADAGAGWRFNAVRTGNTLVAMSRGNFRPTFCFRTAAEWRADLESRGLQVDVHPSGAKVFGNVLFYARKTTAARGL
jgi:uncharacterized protein (DUF2062 family)/SAM-dependent methyltransferase